MINLLPNKLLTHNSGSIVMGNVPYPCKGWPDFETARHMLLHMSNEGEQVLSDCKGWPDFEIARHMLLHMLAEGEQVLSKEDK